MESESILKSMVCCDVFKVLKLCETAIEEIREERTRLEEVLIQNFKNCHNAKADARNNSFLGRFYPIEKLETREDAVSEMDRLYEKTYNHQWHYGNPRYCHTSSYRWEEYAEIMKILTSCKVSCDDKIYLSQEGVDLISRNY